MTATFHGARMTKNQSKDSVGDTIAPPRSQSSATLKKSADQSLAAPAESCAQANVSKPLQNLSNAMGSNKSASPPAESCEQLLWLTFFFDGTGNNLDADVGTNKHSNVAKLFRSHKEQDSINGVYRVYIPGVGTYFKEVGDEGGTTSGKAFGAGGDDRIDWALKRWDTLLAPHFARAQNPSNRIIEINVAVFGFSRGATAARAFANELLESRCKIAAGGLASTREGYPVRIRFMGLYDTVASVGAPMSVNNTAKTKATKGARVLAAERLKKENREVWPSSIAYLDGGTPGADPAPGMYDGHSAYGGNIAISDVVENVQHYIAAHELRNSFPVDSVSVLQGRTVRRSAKCKEYVYPGVHSDVGGSYRPGEGGRSDDPINKLGLITLHHMYEAAITAGVPLQPKAAWTDVQKSDFAIGREIVALFNYYMGKVSKGGTVGILMNAHMRLYYAWRFQSIARKRSGDTREAQAILRSEAVFASEREQLDAEIAKLEIAESRARREASMAQAQRARVMQSNYGNANVRAELEKYDAAYAVAKENHEVAEDALLRAKAKRDALPGTGELEGIVNFYDEQLMRDAQSIRKVYGPDPERKGPPLFRRADLRPHYRALMDAYENEFFNNAGLRDQSILDFFDRYVHDSLSGFAKDATLPSDPRVVYVGADSKMNYAIRMAPSEDERLTA